MSGGFYRDRMGLSERIWRVSRGFEHDVGYIVQRGIAEKKSVRELAADLEQYVKPRTKRDFDWGTVYPDLAGKNVDFNAQRLARTAINHAYFLDNVRVCTENPFVTAMHWDLSNAHGERQVIPFGPDECDEYAEHDEGLGMGNFKPEEIPVPHPQCLCVQWAVIPQSLEDIGAQIGRWASGEPDELLDEWYDKYGSRNPNGDPKEILRGNGGELLQNAAGSGRIKTERGMAEGHRRNVKYILTDEDIDFVLQEAIAICIPSDIFRFNSGRQTGFREGTMTISIRGDVFPDLESHQNRDLLSVRAVLAHEYYGHYLAHPSPYDIGDWRDEFNASYRAALDTPNLTEEDRYRLMIDAYDRAREAGVPYEYDDIAKEIIYGKQ